MILEFHKTSVARSTDSVVIIDLTWSVSVGECWAVIGPNGSGKTTLAEVILGQHRVLSGTFTRTIEKSAIQYVPFRETSRTFSADQYYYQQRYEFSEPDDCPTVAQYLHCDGTYSQLLDQLQIGPLSQLTLIKLSNGQMRRVRLARAIMARPELLILDEPLIGLDQANRQTIIDCLARLAESGVAVMILTRSDIPALIGQVLHLDGTNRIQQNRQPATLSAPRRNTRNTIHTKPTSDSMPAVIQLSDVNVRHGDSALLNGVNWTVRQGERWAITGPNGSGKTTLLSLIAGDHPQAFSNDIRVFGVSRGAGQTLWDWKRPIGLLTPEMQLYFPRMLTGREAASSGFQDKLSPVEMLPEQERMLDELIDYFNLRSEMNKRWWQISTGYQRAFLFIRAVVKSPKILILDEPFQSMDERLQDRIRNWLNTQLATEQTLLFVSHDESEFPTITHRLQLCDGRVVV